MHFKVARILISIGNAYWDLGNPQKHKELLEQALAIEEKHYGRNHFQLSDTLGYLSVTCLELGDHEKARDLLKRALPHKEKHYKAMAKELLERDLITDKKYYRPEYFVVPRQLVNIGKLYGALGDHEKEKELLEKACLHQEM
jgi:FimV-like protein